MVNSPLKRPISGQFVRALGEQPPAELAQALLPSLAKPFSHGPNICEVTMTNEIDFYVGKRLRRRRRLLGLTQQASAIKSAFVSSKFRNMSAARTVSVRPACLSFPKPCPSLSSISMKV